MGFRPVENEPQSGNLEAFRIMVDSVQDYAIFMLSKTGHIMTWNLGAERIKGYKAHEIIGQHFSVFYPEEDKHVKPPKELEIAIRVGKFEEEGWRVRKDGSQFWANVVITALRDRQGQLLGFSKVTRDLTERRKTDERLKASLAEKEVLLKEIHHRVKNNLQITSSLLRIQSGYIGDPRAKALFSESQNRIRSMALVHEKLYQSKDLARINFLEYAQDLVHLLFRSYGADPQRISLTIDGDTVIMGADAAVPAGLILNELVSNSLKHAFPDDRRGAIGIRVKNDNGLTTLSVRDDGVGLPQDLDIHKTDSLGLLLIRNLTAQLNGHLGLTQDRYTEFTISFSPGRPN